MKSRSATRPTSRSFWRKEDPVFGPDGSILKGGMLPHQREWWELPNFVRLLVGGYGSGKSYINVKRLSALALHNSPAPSAIVSPTYPMATETVIATARELFDGKETVRPGFKWREWRTHPHRFVLDDNGRQGVILIYSGEDPQKLKGPNLGAVGIDEPFIQSQAVFDQMVARVRHPKARRKEINLTGTPEELNWGYELVEGELRESFDVGYVRASSRSNLALDPGYVQRLLAGMDEKTAAAYVEGEFVNLSAGLVLHAFDPSLHVEDRAVPDGAEWGCGMDFNVDPMAFIVFWKWMDEIHYVEEFELANSDTQEACAVLRQKYWDRGLRSVYPDASGNSRQSSSAGGKTDFHFIREAGFHVLATRAKNTGGYKNPERRDRFAAANGLLKHDRLTISPSCRRLRRYFQQYTWEGMNTLEGKRMGHLIDAATYPVAYLWPVERRFHVRGELW